MMHSTPKNVIGSEQEQPSPDVVIVDREVDKRKNEPVHEIITLSDSPCTPKKTATKRKMAPVKSKMQVKTEKMTPPVRKRQAKGIKKELQTPPTISSPKQMTSTPKLNNDVKCEPVTPSQSTSTENKATKKRRSASLPDTKPPKMMKTEVKSPRKAVKGEVNASISERFETSIHCHWKLQDVISNMVNIEARIIQNVINLLEKDCTIPFIARYRKDQTGNLQADQLQEIQEAYTSMVQVKKKADTMVKTLEKEKKANPDIIASIYNAKTTAELDHLFAPYKVTNKKTLAQRARVLGLEDSAMEILKGRAKVQDLRPANYCKSSVKGLTNVQEVLTGWQHIIADVISKDREVLDFIMEMCKDTGIMMTSKKSMTATKQENQAMVEGKATTNYKFENYFNFEYRINSLKAHQIMALNRGEQQKVLSVKIELPSRIQHKVIQMCNRKWVQNKIYDKETQILMQTAIEDSYNRLLEPHMIRQIRSNLTKKAEKEAVDIFRKNLRQLLLTPPVRGHHVLGIDPGFKNGCKLAVVSPTGEFLDHAVIYFPRDYRDIHSTPAKILSGLVHKYRCDLIALGNGKGCREMENFLTFLIQRQVFAPIDVNYCIIDESGVSIYSVTKEAEQEFPGLDPNIRSAIGIARRLQDPLLEYVKVEAKHIGVGMYQHDVTENTLKNALESVVIECVSFVGVDINVCPEFLLKKVSGITPSIAKNIIEWRKVNGSFKNRQQLLLVTRLGNKTFEQCAGFVKIIPQTSAKGPSEGNEIIKPKKTKKLAVDNKLNPLDVTIIHPESYKLTEKILSYMGLQVNDFGKPSFINTVMQYVQKEGIPALTQRFGGTVSTMQLICDSLRQPLEYDIRNELEKPLFRKGVTSLSDLRVGQDLTGQVRNCTNFGAFVDIGVGQDGLIHTSRMKGFHVGIGDRVQVKLISIEVDKKRIGLEMINKL